MTRYGRGGLLLCFLGALLACEQDAIPRSLAGLRLTGLVEGAEAQKQVTALHGKRVAPEDSAVAEYGNGRLTLWMSRLRDEAEAQAELESMLSRIRTGRTPFTPPAQVAPGEGVWSMHGPGGAHLVWVSGSRLYWLGGEPGVVDRAWSELPR